MQRKVECIRAPPKGGRYWEIHPRRPRDFPRPERFPEGEARGKSRGSREISRAEGMDFPIPPEFWWSTDILLIINPSTGMDQEIHPNLRNRKWRKKKQTWFLEVCIFDHSAAHLHVASTELGSCPGIKVAGATQQKQERL